MGKFTSDRYLRELFEIGTAYSDPVEVLPNLKVVFRLLTPEELLEVTEKVSEYSGLESKLLVSQIQTLARAIVEINGLILSLSPAETEKLEKKFHKKFSRVDEAAYILMTEFPKFLLDELNVAYTNFQNSVLEKIEDIKKKSKQPSKPDILTSLQNL